MSAFHRGSAGDPKRVAAIEFERKLDESLQIPLGADSVDGNSHVSPLGDYSKTRKIIQNQTIEIILYFLV